MFEQGYKAMDSTSLNGHDAAEDPTAEIAGKIPIPKTGPEEPKNGSPAAGSGDAAFEQKLAHRLVSVVKDGKTELFTDFRGEPFVAVWVGPHREVMELRSDQFTEWLSYEAYRRYGITANKNALEQAKTTLISQARFDGEKHAVYIRVAEHEGKYYLDLGDDTWRAVKIDADGWEIVAQPPVYFRRPPSMLPMPTPVRGGNLNDLARFLNLADSSDQMLMYAWVFDTLRPGGNHPMLVLHGVQGSAKTTTAKILKSLVDPTSQFLRPLPTEEKELAIAAHNCWVMVFDNLSTISLRISNALCRISTGGGFGSRKLYTDAAEMVFDVERPVLMNGIAPEMITQPDLRDRCVRIELPPIPDEKRRPEGEILKAWEQIRPAILGALLDAVSVGLRNAASVKLDRLPRMADFAKWAEACGPILGWGEGEFVNTCIMKRREGDCELVANCPVLIELLNYMKAEKRFEGLVSGLLEKLTARKQSRTGEKPSANPAHWPGSPAAFGALLKTHQPALARLGVLIEKDRSNKGARVVITTRW
jgi:hypothetical protein